jgi:HJR/Mrr/RecB family endonuclease
VLKLARRQSRRKGGQDVLGIVGGIILLVIAVIQNTFEAIQSAYQSLSSLDREVFWGAMMVSAAILWIIFGAVRTKMVQIQRRRLRQQVIRDATLQRLSQMTPTQFEHYMADVYRLLGYSAIVTPRTGDGGKDIILKKNGIVSLAECKLYITTKVGRRDVQIFHSAIIDAGAKEGLFITTGEFTRSAYEYAKGKPIKLIDREQLLRLLAQITKEHSSTETLTFDLLNN